MRRTLAALACLQAADVLTTWLAMRAGGVESNPYPRALIEAGGVAELAAVKALAFFLIAWLACGLPSWSRPWSRLGLQLACVPTAFVVLSNAGIAVR